MTWALLLSGGAALAAVQVPVIEQAIAEYGPPAVVCGTSAGALHALLVGEGREGELRPIWQEVAEVGRAWFMQPNLDPWHGVFTLEPLRRQIKARKAGKKLVIDTRVGVVDLAKKKHRVIRLNRWRWASRVDAVLCSSCQPLVHERRQFRGRYLNDGGIRHVLPSLQDYADYDHVVAVFCSPVGEDRQHPEMPQEDINSAVEQALAAIDMQIDRTVQDDFARVKSWRGPKRTVYAPRSWAAVGAAFDASGQSIDARLGEGAYMADNPVWVG